MESDTGQRSQRGLVLSGSLDYRWIIEQQSPQLLQQALILQESPERRLLGMKYNHLSCQVKSSPSRCCPHSWRFAATGSDLLSERALP